MAKREELWKVEEKLNFCGKQGVVRSVHYHQRRAAAKVGQAPILVA